MAKTQDPGAALPGDVVQITEPGKAQMALMVVEECRRTFTRARMPVVGQDGAVSWVVYRLNPGTYEVVGCARVLWGEVAKARETMIATLKEAKG